MASWDRYGFSLAPDTGHGVKMIPTAAPVQGSLRSRQRLRSLLVVGGVWLSIIAGFVAFRTSNFFVWNDSPSVIINRDNGGWADVTAHSKWLGRLLSKSPLDWLRKT